MIAEFFNTCKCGHRESQHVIEYRNNRQKRTYCHISACKCLKFKRKRKLIARSGGSPIGDIEKGLDKK